MSNEKVTDCIIIGSGPAGYSAAIYAAHGDLNPIVYTGMEPGGQLTTTTDVDNYPGYPNGVTGPQLMENLKKQAERFGAIIKTNYIVRVDLSDEKGGIHQIHAEDGSLVKTRGIIIATGASAKYLGLESEQRLRGAGVSACATCDGFFYKGKDIAVVGGGDTALEEAIYLAKICTKVYLLVRRDIFRGSKAMQHRLSGLSNVEILFRYEVEEVLGKKVVEGIKTIVWEEKNGKKTIAKRKTINIEGLFIAIGHRPNTEIFEDQLDLDNKGYIITEKGNTSTNKPGVFAAGDVQDAIYRQAITSAGTGCMAALDLEKYLSKLPQNV
ncbi:MAG: thioredoxin-disulfide reductase [Flavobacteriales bacterium AspAUS03]